MKRIISLSILSLVLFVSISSVIAVSQDELNQAKTLIDSNISCNKFTNDQLEIIGEYYMEQMMPGEAHVRAHQMMGLTEGSEAEEQFHINLAKRDYCGENIGGMMGNNMMGNYNYQNPQNNKYYQNSLSGFQVFFYIILTLVIIILILVIILLINKSKQKRRKTK